MATLAIKPPARTLLVAPRLPQRPKEHTGNPFTTVGDVVLDCDVPGCSPHWHGMGARADVIKAWREHYRQNHASAQMTGVVLINHPRHQ